MINNKKAKGLTFLETIATIAIISSVSLFFYIKLNKFEEKRDLEISRRLIKNTIYKYTLQSVFSKERYKLEIYLIDKKIDIKGENYKIIESIHLPKKLKYEIIYKYQGGLVFNVETTPNGNLSKAFTIYICDYNNLVQNRISFYTFQIEKILKINSYINFSAGKIKYIELPYYHYSEDSKNRKGWKIE
ncbi:hypothetical protein [uncultured Cetobacterium sp.]|uniref:hypothetical protein n=1 Tax=uncultured Cetobacterium sp. TaxID=527638 RepID=UPI002620B817|nr:hypothetical protein [uncultured Cetobacterium sp.]